MDFGRGYSFRILFIRFGKRIGEHDLFHLMVMRQLEFDGKTTVRFTSFLYQTVIFFLVIIILINKEYIAIGVMYKQIKGVIIITGFNGHRQLRNSFLSIIISYFFYS